MLKIKYNNITINKQYLTPSQTCITPSVFYIFKPDKLYTLVMYDPDTPMGDYIHWLIINIKDKISNGEVIIPYKGPSPPINTGIHRYIFYLYEQNNTISNNTLNNIERTIEYQKLLNKLHINTKPIANSYFTSKYQNGGKIKKYKKTKKTKTYRFNKSCKKYTVKK